MRFLKAHQLAIGLTALALFLALSWHANQQRPKTLEELIERSNQQLIERKMTQLYGGAYE